MSAAYYLSWSSAWRAPVVAQVQFHDGDDEWRTVDEWTGVDIGRGRDRMLDAILRDLDKPHDPEWIAYLGVAFSGHLRIELSDLLAVLDDGLPVTLF